MVIDYSETVNKFTDFDAYPFPDVDSIVNRAAENNYFSKIDLKSAYHQIPLKEDDQPFTAFEVAGNLYQFKRMPFGITNAVPTFQRIMDQIISANKLEKTYAYLDDVIVCGETSKQHDDNLEKFMNVIKQQNMTINHEKCQLKTQKIEILGYVIENSSKRPNSERLSALIEFPTPNSPHSLRRLLGLFAYNSKWIKDYSEKISPLLESLAQSSFPLNVSN